MSIYLPCLSRGDLDCAHELGDVEGDDEAHACHVVAELMQAEESLDARLTVEEQIEAARGLS